MKEFLALNKTILRKSFLWMGVVLSVLFSLYLCFTTIQISIKWILIIYSITFIIFPLYVLAALSFDWFRKRRYKRKILSKYPYSELATIGFTKKILKENHNSLVDYVAVGEINGYQVTFDIYLRTPKVLAFTVHCEENDLNYKAYVNKIREYAYLNIDFVSGAFTKNIHTTKDNIQSIQQLHSILSELTQIAMKERCKPRVLVI